ncbi:MAG: hypothetical protein IT454_11185 [Planctomycetes bacterium]|nr:hypothetical protein [Planctomycetota bacterium]
MTVASASKSRLWGARIPRATLSCVGLPYAAALLGCLLVRPEVGSLVAPRLGPWGGEAYGHSDCTMAAALPATSAAVVGLLAVASATSWFLRAAASKVARAWSRALLALAATGWFALAWLSAVNSTS